MTLIVRAFAAATAAALLSSAGALPIRDEIRDLQWHLDYLHVDDAHKASRGAGVLVAVVDTGVEATHPDLANNVLPGADFAGLTLGDGREDRDGHGTAMAGLIVAHGRATGIAPESRILPVRYQVISGIPTSVVAQSIDWAVDHGADVLCLAFVGVESTAIREAVARAIAKDVIVVAGVGNTFTSSEIFPGAYPGVVTAAGIDKDGSHASFSITGAQAVLAAPAVRILSTVPRSISADGYGTTDGTSNSTAIIAGVAALIRSKYPNLSASEVIHRMTATADDKGPPGRDNEYGYGIVNPVKALTADVPPLTPTAQPTNATNPPPDTISQTGTLLIVGGVILALLLGTGLALALRRRP